MRRLGLIPLLCAAALTSQAADRVFDSGPQKVRLIELFTSEGCSSCPPAEAWLSKLKSDPRLWKDFVPFAFHVDYWDHLGWRDPFASKEWTARQYRYSAAWKNDGVYTPGFVVDARESQDRNIPTSSSDKPGVLKITLANDNASAEFNPANGAANEVDLHVAMLGFDLNTKPSAGENNGRNLRQDFVVLSVVNEKMSSGKAEIHLATDSRAGAVAAWITAPNQLKPIQAVGGWLR